MTEACPGWRQVRLGSWMTQRLKTRRVPGKHNHNNNSSKNVWTMKTNCKEDRVSQLPSGKIPHFGCWLIWDLLLMFRNEKKGMVGTFIMDSQSPWCSGLFALEIMFNETDDEVIWSISFSGRELPECQGHHAFECIARYSSDLEMLNGVGSRNEAHVFQDSRGYPEPMFSPPKIVSELKHQPTR